MAEAHREGVASTVSHLSGLGNSNILLGPGELMGALPWKVQLGRDLRGKPRYHPCPSL